MGKEFTIYSEGIYECSVIGSDIDLNSSKRTMIGSDLQVISGEEVMQRIELASDLDIKGDTLHLVLKFRSEDIIKRSDMYICLLGVL